MEKLRDTILTLIDAFFDVKVIKYVLSAILATLVDISVYYIAFNYIFKKQSVLIFGFTVGAPAISLVMSFSCGLITSFTMTRLFVFNESDLKAHHQFLRFILVAIVIFILNYGLMSLLINYFKWYPTVARAFSAISIGGLSFFSHKFFTFKVSSAESVE